MPIPKTRLVFDNSPLSHFARAGLLDVLERIVTEYICVSPAEVITEIFNGASEYPALAKVLTEPWIQVVENLDVRELVAFAHYKRELGGGPDRNNGEAAVLAWTKINGGVAIIDERAGTRIAQRENIEVHGTLSLVLNGTLERVEAETVVDQLKATGMILPVDGAGLFAWAYQEGILP
jgi:predicted nucleic acid-binding protein